MIDVLYIKGKTSINNDLEIKYSLRSLEQYVMDYGRIFITGECPDFIDQKKVVFTPADDIGTPMTNHWWKVFKTIQMTDISDYFVLMYDDIFFTTVTKLATYPPYQRGFLGEQHTGSARYRACLEETKKWLESKGLPWYDFELHIPFIYNRDKFMKMGANEGRAVRSTYGNMFLEPPMHSPYRTDIKIRATDEHPSDLPSMYDCFSVSDSAFKYEVKKWCEKSFKEKSRWEK